MSSHKALGRGLNALFSQPKAVLAEENGAVATLPSANDVKDISVDKIKPNRHQPRLTFDPAALEELAASIKSHGLAQPLLVTEVGTSGEFELVAGERRLRASKMAGLATVPCMVKKMTNRERFEVALVENIQREDLNAYEEAVALDGLMKEFDLTQEQVATAIGKSRSAVANVLRLLKLHENVQAALRSGLITEGHAKCLAGLTEHSDQLHWLSEITSRQLTVRDLENSLSEKKTEKKSAKKEAAPTSFSVEVKKMEEQFQRTLSRRVEIQSKGKRGFIRFEFYTPEDFETLCAKLGLPLPKADA